MNTTYPGQLVVFHGERRITLHYGVVLEPDSCVFSTTVPRYGASAVVPVLRLGGDCPREIWYCRVREMRRLTADKLRRFLPDGADGLAQQRLKELKALGNVFSDMVLDRAAWLSRLTRKVSDTFSATPEDSAKKGTV